MDFNNPRDIWKKRGWGCYPDEGRPEGPVPPPLPVPNCLCDMPAEVKQSKCERTAGRAYYVCRAKYDRGCSPCYFFQWIDGPKKYDPRIRLFAYHESELRPYNEFRRWVPPPPNPAPMTEEQKAEAASIRVKNPPLCHCGHLCKLQRPHIGVTATYTPFFRCKLKTHDGWPRCDFQEYIHGPKSHWPTEEEIQMFHTGEKTWPCDRRPEPWCKCGIVATVGVVPSELGYGYFCGNAYGKYWEGRTCVWEDFAGREKLRRQLGRQLEPLKTNTTQKIKSELRRKHDIPLPEREVEAKVSEDMRREKGVPPRGYYLTEEIIAYWRLHRDKYPRDLTHEEKVARREKAEAEWQMKIKRRRKEEACKAKDPNTVYPYGTWEHYFKTVEDKKRRSEMEEMDERARDAQMEAVRALVADLPSQIPELPNKEADKKGKRVANDNTFGGESSNVDGVDPAKPIRHASNWFDGVDDEWGDDELLCDGDSD